MKKVIVISTSLRAGSNSHAMAEQFAKGAEAAGHQVEFVSLRGKEIKFCVGCLSCQKTGACVIKDDVPAIMESVLNADVVIRAYRKLGIDLQQEVHLDMQAHFDKYPKKWGMKHTDANIDHRRVPNLMTFFSRKGTVLEISDDPEDYRPDDIVCWNLGGGTTHIGIVSKEISPDGTRHLIIHNIGAGQVLEDCLFNFKIIGHYRYSKN